MKFEIRDGVLFGEGNLDEDSQLDQNMELPGDQFNFDLGSGGAVNSVGIRLWLPFIGALADRAKITLVNVPYSFVLQMNMIKGFLPEKASISSFRAPIYCEDTDEEKEILLVVGEDISLDGDKPELTKVLEDGWEYDFTSSDFFKFLEK